MEKRCFKCNAVKPLSDFYKHPRMADGHLNKCKECAKRDVHQNRDEKRDYYILYDRMRNDDPERTAARLEGVERRKHTEEYKEQMRQYRKRWAERNPEKRAAHIAVGNAVRDGRLVRQPCNVCGCLEVEAHHEDYSRALDVTWLCKKHHGETWRKSREVV